MFQGNEKKSHIFFTLLLFITGGLIMVFELIASRILAPAFGTTITVWTAIIGVVLASISFGYYQGGRAKELTKNLDVPAAALLFAAFWTWFILFTKEPLLNIAIIPWYGIRALFLSTIFFALPAFCLAFVNTFCIRVAEEGRLAIGTINGVLYGASTLGSAFGIIITSFYLIPHYPVSVILKGVGVLLLLLSAILFLISRINRQ